MKRRIRIMLLVLGCAGVFLHCQKPDKERKIRLSSQPVEKTAEGRLSTTVYLEEQRRRSMAVWFFENQTGDESLEWLRKGLTEMFIRALSQSHSLSVLGTDRLYEIAERMGQDVTAAEMNMDMAAVFAQEANVEALLTGNISKHGDSLQINIRLHEPDRGLVLSSESAEGPGLENLFAMVDQLTQKLKQDLHLATGKQSERGLAELSTGSIEAWRHYTAGQDLQNQMLVSKALKEFQKAVRADSMFVSAHRMLAMVYFGMGDTQKAIQAYQKAQSLKEKATLQEKLQIDLLEALLNSDDEALLSIHEKMLEADPNNIDASYTLANYYFGDNRYEESLAYYRKVLEIDPKHKMSLNQIGYACALVGDLEGAKKAFSRYIEIAPDEPNPYDSLGEVVWIHGDYKKAETYFKTALKKNPAFTAGWDHLGQIYLEQGKYEKALEAYRTVRNMETERAPLSTANYHMGIAAMRMNRDDEAEAYFKKALDLLRTSTGPMDRLMEIYRNRNDQRAADQFIETMYGRLLKDVESGDESINQIGALAYLSLDYGMSPEKTLEVVQNVSGSMELFNIRILAGLMQTLLKFQLHRPDPSGSLVAGNAPQGIRIMNAMRNFGYANVWNYFARINEYFYRHPESGRNFYKGLIELCSEEPSRAGRMVFRMLRSDLTAKTGDLEAARIEWARMGVPDESLWQVIGPFENRNGFVKRFPPEKKLDFHKPCEARGQRVAWRAHADTLLDAFIDLKQDFDAPDWGVAYAALDVVSESDREAWIRLGVTDGIKMWVNGDEVWRFNRNRTGRFDDDNVAVFLKKGRNRILIKSCNILGYWGFYFRITDDKGNGIPAIRFTSPVGNEPAASD